MSIITLDEAKNYLRVDSADDNALITSLIESAEDLVEKFTWRTLLTKTFELVYDSVGESIEIPKSPLQEVTKIEVISDAGTKTEVSSSTYVVDITGSRGRVMLKSGCVWPSHRGFASFIITAKAGYGDLAASVPAALKQAILAALAALYSVRGGAVDSYGRPIEAAVSSSISGICAAYMVIRL